MQQYHSSQENSDTSTRWVHAACHACRHFETTNVNKFSLCDQSLIIANVLLLPVSLPPKRYYHNGGIPTKVLLPQKRSYHQSGILTKVSLPPWNYYHQDVITIKVVLLPKCYWRNDKIRSRPDREMERTFL